MLGRILDAMSEVKVQGLSREKLHAPLLDDLEKLGEHPELRLRCAARYARQALLSIPNDEGPWSALWRTATSVAGPIAQIVAGSMTMNPGQLLGGVLEADPKSIVEFGNALVSLIGSLGRTYDVASDWHK